MSEWMDAAGLCLLCTFGSIAALHQMFACCRRLVDGVEVLARILHPDQVSKTIPVATVMKLSLLGGQRCRPHMLHQYFKPYQ